KKISILLFVSFLSFTISCKKDKNTEEVTNVAQTPENKVIQEALRMMQQAPPLAKDERALLDELQVMAKDIDVYYKGVDEEIGWEAKYNKIRQNMHNRVDEAAAKASILYNGNEGKIILAKNSYVLMSYHFLERYMSEFMWTKLGLFAANDVRFGIALCYTMREVLEMTKLKLPVEGIEDMDMSQVLYESARILMTGQINVFTDIGALGLLNHKYGPEPFINETWLTQEARNGYTIQKQAQKALADGNIDTYQDLQTEAAIWFGAHEQLYTLDPLWSTDIMGMFADLNIKVHNATKGEIAVFGDLFIGVNKLTQALQGYMIKLPMDVHDLRIGSHRVGIAINGFNTLNRLRKDKKWKNWVEMSENRLGDQKGIYNIKGFMP
ncbi:MAG: hypothetical protein M9887_05075, partial [Chitinophagales bacterium]|nr:hypothetical protein [Chitinophagales bacterium]